MRAIRSENWLKVSASLLLVFSVVSLLAVSERVIAAIWQWYKFFGYETAGVITLSKRTGAGFVIASMAAILACVIVKRLSERKALIGVRLSKWALFISCASLAMYCAIALSPLNAWRP